VADDPRFIGPLAELWAPRSPDWLDGILLAPEESLPIPPADDRAVWAPTVGSADQNALAAIMSRADDDLGRPWPIPRATQYARYFRDGDRDEYEQTVFARQRRLSRAAVAAATTLAPEWLDEVADGVILLCEQSSWCWPAHDDTHRRHGAVLPTASSPFLDLGAGEVVAQLAWIDHLLGRELDEHVPGVCARIRHEAALRVIDPFLTRRDWHWIGLDGDVHNWNPWIHGNVLVAALALMEPSPARDRVIGLVVEGLDRYVAALPPDGATDEGYSYWWNGACRALEALGLLAHATGGRLDAVSQVPALRATVAFPHRMHLGDDWYLNVADGQARPTDQQPWQAVHQAALRVGDDLARAHAVAHRDTAGALASEALGLGRLLGALTDPEWLRSPPMTSPLPRDVWLPSIQVLMARPTAGSTAGLTLAAKGGNNGEHHNHNDVGSAVVALGGVPVLVDAGRPTYTAQTFGPDRYGIWTMQSSWHGVPEIRGVAQPAGAQYAARDVRAVAGASTTSLTLDLALCYPKAGVRSWRRTSALDREFGIVTITDTWQLDADPLAPACVLHLVLAGAVEQTGDRSLLVHALEDAGTVEVEASAGTFSIEVKALDDPLLSEVWGPELVRATVTLGRSTAGTCTVSIRETAHGRATSRRGTTA